MSEIKIEFQTDVLGDYWEEAITREGETPRQCAERIVKGFNDTLRPNEEFRTVTAVREAPDAKILRKHDWEKQNSFTIMKPRPHDIHKCRKCGAMGKRFELGSDVKIDYRSRGKKECV